MTARLIAPALAGALLLASPSFGATQLTPLTVLSLSGTTYGQNFDSLAASGLSNALPTGWQVAENGTGGAVDGQYAAGTGSSNAGNSYSYGSAGSTDRALGSLTSGTVTPISFGLIFTNDSGSTITSIDIAYFGEQWRLANASGDALAFQYALGATDVSDTGGSWTALAALDFASVKTGGTSSGTALDGNDPANRAGISGTIGGLSIAGGQSFAIRWRDIDVTGSDNGLAIDDVSLTTHAADAASAVPEPASWAMMVGGFGLIGGAMRRRPRALAKA